MKPKDLYDIGKRVKEDDDDDTYTQSMPYDTMSDYDLHDTNNLVRLDIEEGIIG